MRPLSEAEFPAARALWERLRSERVILDPRVPAELAVLRADVERIARDMDDPARPPPMLWSGIPWPDVRRGDVEAGPSEWCLSISVGGTNTVFLLLRLDGDEVVGLDPSGQEVSGDDIERLASSCRIPTPTARDVANGLEMIDRICAEVGHRFSERGEQLASVRHVLLSWGYPGRTVRTSESVLGGLTARTSVMTKEQQPFTPDLAGEDVGELFRAALERHVGWSRPVTVANDAVMALHWFLTPAHRALYAQIGLFINGTGSNFCLAEPYRVRPEGLVSRGRETYVPERAHGSRSADGSRSVDGETRRFFVNYEIGSIELEATRLDIDVCREYPIEMNALSGGNAFTQQFRALVQAHLGAEVHRRLLAGFRGGRHCADQPGGPDVARIATGSGEDVDRVFRGAVADDAEREALWLICRAVFARSALHAALVLAAVTRRTRFGLGDENGRPDLLGIEGSVWRTPGYAELVRWHWERLVEAEGLHVDVAHEPHYNASLRGPVYLASLHR